MMGRTDNALESTEIAFGWEIVKNFSQSTYTVGMVQKHWLIKINYIENKIYLIESYLLYRLKLV